MALISPNHSKSYKVKSISFPARSNQVQDTSTIAEDLEKFNSWLAVCPPQAETICNGLEGLNQLYDNMKQLLGNSPQTSRALSNPHYEKWIVEMIDGSMLYVDICSTAKDAICQMSECISEFQSALRRKKGNEIDIESNVEGYMMLRKNVKKGMEKSLLVLKQLENKFGSLFIDKGVNNHLLLEVVRVLSEVSLATNLILQKLLIVLSVSIVKPKVSKWFLAKSMTKGADSAQECVKNEFEDVDIEVMKLPIHSSTQISEDYRSVDSALEKLESLEMSMKAFENGLESLFKNLIYMRVAYLNISSQ